MGPKLCFIKVCTKIAVIIISSVLLCSISGGTTIVNGYTDENQNISPTAPEDTTQSIQDENTLIFEDDPSMPETTVDTTQSGDTAQKDGTTQKEGTTQPGDTNGEEGKEQNTDEDKNDQEQKTDDKKEKDSGSDQKNKPVPDDAAIDFKKELQKLGYYNSNAKDKKLEERNAIILFQSDHNLVVDGIWGKKSLAELKKRLTGNTFSYPDKIKKAPTEENWITINKTKRILTLYKGKQVLKKYPVAIGNPASKTPDGKMSVVIKVKNPAWGGGGYAKPVPGGSPNNPLGYRWLGLSLKGGSSYGIHGTNKPYSIGTNASHGCIRMLNQCVEELYDMVKKGIPVWIGSDAKIQEWGVNQPQF